MHGDRLNGDIEKEASEAVVAAAAVVASSSSSSQLTGAHEEASSIQRLVMEIQRMRTALTRTQSTERSCEVRLTLAEWLPRRLRRGKLHTDDHSSRP